MLKRLLVSLEITRPHNMLVAAFGAVAGYVIAGGRELADVLELCLLTAAVTGAGNVINDTFDVDIDRINKPRRPLPSRRVTRRAAVHLYLGLTVAATVAAVVLAPRVLLALVVVWQVLLLAYAWVLKRVLIAGNVLVAAVSASAFLAGGALAGNWRAAGIPMAIAFLFVLCREVVKGAEDVAGDAVQGVKTIAVFAGVDRAARVAAAMMLVLAGLLPLPALAGIYDVRYFWLMELLVAPTLVIGAIWIVRAANRRTFGAVSWMLKGAMFFGILAIVAGGRA